MGTLEAQVHPRPAAAIAEAPAVAVVVAGETETYGTDVFRG